MTNITLSLVVTESYSKSFTNAVVSALSIVAICGAFGNGLVVAVICRAKKLRSVMNRFVLHLAVSDLIVCVFGIPLFLVINFEKTELNLNASTLTMCKVGRFVQYLAPLASLTLLITIGMNRHQAIVRPLNIMTFRKANKLIAAAWMFALVITAPSLYLTELQVMIDEISNTSYPYCATIPTDVVSGLIYTTALSLLGYVIPLIILIVLYTKIYLTVWRRPKAIAGKNVAGLPASRLAKTKKKVLKMLITVIFFFLVTWLPLFIYVGIIQPLLRRAKPVDHVRLTTYSLGLSQSSVNPIIYGFYNKNFRDGCKEVFRVSFRVVSAPAEMIHRSLKNKSAYSPKKEADLTNFNRQRGALRRGKYRSKSAQQSRAEKDSESLIDDETCQHQISLKRSGGMRLKEAFNKMKSNSEGGKILEFPDPFGPDKQKLIACKSDGCVHIMPEPEIRRKRCNTADNAENLSQRKFYSQKTPLGANNLKDGVLLFCKGEECNHICNFQPEKLKQLQSPMENVNSHLYKAVKASKPTEKVNGQNDTDQRKTSISSVQWEVAAIPRCIRFMDDFEDTKL